MSEEEKQAIEKFSNLMTKHFEDKKIDTIDYLDYIEGITILNLIEKQQKEIEKLKSRKYILNAETNEIKEIPISDDYISKDKIKEYINSPEFLDWHLGFKLIDELEYRKDRINELLGE